MSMPRRVVTHRITYSGLAAGDYNVVVNLPSAGWFLSYVHSYHNAGNLSIYAYVGNGIVHGANLWIRPAADIAQMYGNYNVGDAYIGMNALLIRYVTSALANIAIYLVFVSSV